MSLVESLFVTRAHRLSRGRAPGWLAAGAALTMAIAWGGCGGRQLRASGEVEVELDGTLRSVSLPNDTVIDGSRGAVSGSCVLTRSGDDYGVMLDLSIAGSGDARPLTSVSVLSAAGASVARVEATLGADTFENATCPFTLTAADSGGALVFSVSGCSLVAGSETADASVRLAVDDCLVR